MLSIHIKIFGLLALGSIVHAGVNVKMVPHSTSCVSEMPQMIESYNCHIEKTKERNYIMGHIQFKRPIKTLTVFVRLYAVSRSLPRFELLNTHMDLCKVFAAAENFVYVDFMVRIVKKFVNEMPLCPLKPHFNYTVAGAYFDSEDIAIVLPSGNFTLTINVYDKKIKAGHFILKGEIKVNGPNVMDKKWKSSG